MKKMRVLTAIILSAVLAISCLSALPAQAAKPKPKSVTIQNGSKITVYAGTEFELKAKMNPVKANDNYLRWKIVSGSKYIKFDDNDRNDDEVDFRAVKAGTAKVKCYIKGNEKKSDTITITVKKASYGFSRVGAASRTVVKGHDFELKVKKTGSTKDNDLKWSIKDKNIVKFDDFDTTDDDVELIAVKAGTTTVTCTHKKTGKKINYKITVKKASAANSISRVGNATKYVELGDDFDLEVKKSSGLKNKYLKWSIKNTKIVDFDGYTKTGNEVDFRAKKIGSTTVTCTNTQTGKKVTYTVKVVYDDDLYDDDDD